MHPVQTSGLVKSLCLIAAAAILTAQVWAQDGASAPAPQPAEKSSSGVSKFIKGVADLMSPDAAKDKEPDDAAKLKQKVEELGGEASVAAALGMGQPTDIFKSDEEILELMGENPRWIWRNDPEHGRPDPMLIPWVAEERIFNTKTKEAEDLENQGRLYEALEIYELMLLNIQDANYRTAIDNRLFALKVKIAEREKVAKALGDPSRNFVEPTLPSFIVSETRGIIYDRSPGGSSLVSVGDQNLTEGDEVEGFENVKVKKINDQSVIFTVTNEYVDKDFDVQVKGNPWDEM